VTIARQISLFCSYLWFNIGGRYCCAVRLLLLLLRMMMKSSLVASLPRGLGVGVYGGAEAGTGWLMFMLVRRYCKVVLCVLVL
jgi:hypothetical protein